MARISMGTMGAPIRARPEDEQDAEVEALDRMRREIAAIPDAPPSSLTPLPTSQPDPERSSATARTLDGDWSDATTEQPTPPASPNLHQADAEGEALSRLASESRVFAPTMPQAPPQPLAPSAAPPEAEEPPTMVLGPEDDEAIQAMADRPEAMVRPDDSMSPDDDSPDSLHAMQPLAPDDAEPLGDQGRGQMVAPSGQPEDFEGRVSRLARGGDFRQEVMPGNESDPMEAEPDGDADDPLLSLAEAEAGPAPKPSGPTTGPGALDEGLPSEADIAGGRERDQFLGPLRHLQAGLRGALGRPHRAMDSDARPLLDERSRGLRERLAAKGVERRAETEAAQQAERQASTNARADTSADIAERRLDLAERQFASMDTSRDRSADRMEADSAARRAATGQDSDPQSAASRGARLAFQVARQTRLRQHPELGPEMDAALAEAGIDPATATSAELDRATRIVSSIGVRGAGGGGAGGHGALEERRAALRARLEARGQDPTVADALDASHLQSALLAETRQDTSTSQGEELLPGVRAGIDLDRGEGRQVRTGYATARAQHQSLATVRGIASRYGASGRIDPSAQAELDAPYRRLLSMVAQMQGTGIINPTEMPAIQAALPDPTSLSQMTFGTFMSRMEGFERELDAGIAAALDARGVDQEGIARALRGLRGASMAQERSDARPAPSGASSAPQGGTVRVRGPDGTVRPVSRAQIPPGGLPAGYSEVP